MTWGALLRRLRPLVGALIVVLLTAWAWPRRDELAAAFRDLGGSVLPAALVLGLALVLAVATWRASLAAVGTRLDTRESVAVYLPAQLGKYLPGALWPVLGQADRAGDFGVSRRSVAVGGALAVLVAALTAATVGVFAIAPLGGLALVVSVVCAVALATSLLLAPGPLLRAGARVLPGWAGTVSPDPPALRRALRWGWATWLVQGLHLLPLLVASGVGWREALVLRSAATPLRGSPGLLPFRAGRSRCAGSRAGARALGRRRHPHGLRDRACVPCAHDRRRRPRCRGRSPGPRGARGHGLPEHGLHGFDGRVPRPGRRLVLGLASQSPTQPRVQQQAAYRVDELGLVVREQIPVTPSCHRLGHPAGRAERRRTASRARRPRPPRAPTPP